MSDIKLNQLQTPKSLSFKKLEAHQANLDHKYQEGNSKKSLQFKSQILSSSE